MFEETVFGTIFFGVISNIVFTVLLIYVFQQIRYYWYLKRRFHNREFFLYRKRFPNEWIQKANCRVVGNRIKFTGSKPDGETDKFEGEIIINPINLKFGEGYIFHEGREGYNFMKVIIRDADTFYVENPYIAVKRSIKKPTDIFSRIVYQAFVWRKQKKR